MCCKCNVEMVEQKVKFDYMNVNLTHDVPQCPVCGQIYLSEETVSEKIYNVEKQLEEK